MLNVRIKGLLKSMEVDAIFLKKWENVRWASGFRGADSYLLCSNEQAFLITDPRYTEQAAVECPEMTIVNWKQRGSIARAAADITNELNIRRLAFEDDAVPYRLYADLCAETGCELFPAGNNVDRLRMVKTQEEIDCLSEACAIACRAFYRIIDDIRPGVTEKELAARLSTYMVFEGADSQQSGFMVVSGPNSSMLHGISSDRPLEYGDLVLMDYGCRFNGYISDMTRTVVLGCATDEQRKVYSLVRQMLEDSLAVMKAGVKTEEVYAAAVGCIKDTDYFKYHYTGIGHGIGLFVHEQPLITPKGSSIYEPNIVTTIEPGLYIPGWGGIRIEDQVVIKDDGNENLISVPHEMIEVPQRI